MMYRIEPLYYASPDFKKMDGETYINLRYVLSITLHEKYASIFTAHGNDRYSISKNQAMEILQVMQTMEQKDEVK